MYSSTSCKKYKAKKDEGLNKIICDDFTYNRLQPLGPSVI